jgi:hypothetical protein
VGYFFLKKIRESVEAPLKVLLLSLILYRKQKDVQNRCHFLHAAKLSVFWRIASVILSGLKYIDYTKIMDSLNNIFKPLFLSRHKRRMPLYKSIPRLHPWLPYCFRWAPWMFWCSLWNTIRIWFSYTIIRKCGQCFWRVLRVCHMLLWSRSDGWLLCNRIREDTALRKLWPLTLFCCELGQDSHYSTYGGTLRSMPRNTAYCVQLHARTLRRADESLSVYLLQLETPLMERTAGYLFPTEEKDNSIWTATYFVGYIALNKTGRIFLH